MSTKTAVWIGVFAGSVIGGYVPSIFGAGILSYWSVLTSAIGSIIGILIAIKITS